MPGPDDILQRMLQQNPVVRNNPNNAPILNALEHRDAQSGLHGAEPERLLRWPAELLSVLRLLSHGKKV
jgi:hypothetical protein